MRSKWNPPRAIGTGAASAAMLVGLMLGIAFASLFLM